MSLLNKAVDRLKYLMPEMEIVKTGDDIITKSIPVAKSTSEELVEETEKKEQTKQLTFYEKYPDGLPVEVLELIDFSHFGAMLKQEQLLPPSYGKRPTDVAVYIGKKGLPVLILTFNSKTSNSYRKLMVVGYVVSESINNPIGYITNADISSQWQEFAQRVMYLWERGYRFEQFDQQRKGEIQKFFIDETTLKNIHEREKIREMSQTLMQEDMEYIESVKEIAKWNKKAQEKDLD